MVKLLAHKDFEISIGEEEEDIRGGGGAGVEVALVKGGQRKRRRGVVGSLCKPFPYFLDSISNLPINK